MENIGNSMNDEYKALRDEIMKWQDRRFVVLQFSVSLVTALLGLKLVVDDHSINEIWPLISIVLLLYLCAANLLTCYAGVANAKLAAYLKVFHETSAANTSGFRWESRLQQLKKRELDNLDLNMCIAVIYVALGFVSVAIPGAPAKYSLSGTWVFAFLVVAVVLFLLTVVVLLRFSYPRKSYVDKWAEIQEEESSKIAGNL